MTDNDIFSEYEKEFDPLMEARVTSEAFTDAAQKKYDEAPQEVRDSLQQQGAIVAAALVGVEQLLHKMHSVLPRRTMTIAEVESFIAQQTLGFEHLATGGSPAGIRGAMGPTQPVYAEFNQALRVAATYKVGSRIRVTREALPGDLASVGGAANGAPTVGDLGTITEIGVDYTWAIDIEGKPSSRMAQAMGIEGWVLGMGDFELVTE